MLHAVLGCGVVGSEHVAWLRDTGADVVAYDPPRGLTPELGSVRVAWVCVPTPFKPPAVDLGPLAAALSALAVAMPTADGGPLVAIRSTVPPGTTEALAKRYPMLRLAFVPEFLTERRARRDFRHPARSLVGLATATETDARLLLHVMPSAPYSAVVTATTAEMVKCAGNAGYALKVAYWNQVFDLAGALGVDYDVVREAMAADPMTGPEHLDALRDGYRGFGGKCLPKDTAALHVTARARGVSMTLLAEALLYNARIKPRTDERSDHMTVSDSVGVAVTR